MDAFLLQCGPSLIYLSDDVEECKGDGRKLRELIEAKGIEAVYVKRSSFKKYDEGKAQIGKLKLDDSHLLAQSEVDRPLSLACLSALVHCQQIRPDDDGATQLKLGALSSFMRLDSAAAEAVNLLPRPDHPSQLGSVFGVLNRCRTRMGSRLLERWLRQPLVDAVEICKRQDVVELLVHSALARNALTESLLKSLPDLDGIATKMAGHRAGLKEMVALWNFTNALPKLIGVCEELARDADHSTGAFSERVLEVLQSVADKFETYQRLVEHVVDLARLPDLVVNCRHDEQLAELSSEQDALQTEAEEVLAEARDSWAVDLDVRLERHSIFGFVLRSPRSLDERQVQSRGAAVVLAIKKNGVHFSTATLQSVSRRMQELDKAYERAQAAVVGKAMEAAVTYVSVAELAASAVAELDVYASLASVAALSPEAYVRPTFVSSGGIQLERARHPCVELMDGVAFIPNDYHLVPGESAFQVLTKHTNLDT